ncbi:MAG: YceI family protein [Roseovarius sp.]
MTIQRLSAFAGICAATTLGIAPPANAEPATWEIDPEHTVVAFTVMHIDFAKVLGRFSEIEGRFVYDPETRELGQVRVEIGAQSVDTDHAERDGHVRSDDFLDTGNHPTIRFAADGGTPQSETQGTVTGDLTIRGVTQPVTLDVTLNKRGDYPFGHGKETLGISATAEIQRSDFGMTYALPTMVGDTVDIMLEFEALRAD